MPLARRPSYPRRQQVRRIKRAGAAGAAAASALGLAIITALAGLPGLALVLLSLAVGLGTRARHWARLAGRARVGARSEAQVQQALAVLEHEGWRLRHSLPWQGRGDIDHVAIAPTAVAFAIETKTCTYHAGHLARVREQAGWLRRRRRRWSPRGAVAVLCVARGHHVEHHDHEVLIVSVERLASALRTAAGTAPSPAFLVPAPPESP